MKTFMNREYVEKECFEGSATKQVQIENCMQLYAQYCLVNWAIFPLMLKNGCIGVADLSDPPIKERSTGQAFSYGTTLRGAKWLGGINSACKNPEN